MPFWAHVGQKKIDKTQRIFGAKRQQERGVPGTPPPQGRSRLPPRIGPPFFCPNQRRRGSVQSVLPNICVRVYLSSRFPHLVSPGRSHRSQTAGNGWCCPNVPMKNSNGNDSNQEDDSNNVHGDNSKCKRLDVKVATVIVMFMVMVKNKPCH